MQNKSVSKTRFAAVSVFLFLNAVVSTANVVQDGALLHRVIPAASWIIATVVWIAAYRRRVTEKVR